MCSFQALLLQKARDENVCLLCLLQVGQFTEKDAAIVVQQMLSAVAGLVLGKYLTISTMN